MKVSNWFSKLFAKLRAKPEDYKLSTARGRASAGDDTILDVALDAAKEGYAQAHEARAGLEEKASTLIGFAGILAGLTPAIMPFIPTLMGTVQPWAFHVVMAALGTGVVFLWITIYKGTGVHQVRKKLAETIVSVETPFDILDQAPTAAKREWLASMVCSTVNNQRVNNAKASALRAAQFHLVLALTSILFGTLFGLAAFVLWHKPPDPPTPPTLP